ncbi:MAG: gamma-glutamyltransferase, partial [Bradymonadaceae bacterium]
MGMPRHCCRAVTISGLLVATSIGAITTAYADDPDLSSHDDHIVRSTAGVVATDHPLASKTAADILAAGGNAADAGVTALLSMGVVNPAGSGLGGGGFCLYRPVDTGEITTLDFRENAPAAAHRDLYVVDGELIPELAGKGGLAIGVPGEVAGVWALHGRFGSLDWPDVVEPARQLAEEGFEVGPLLGSYIQSMSLPPELSALFRNEEGQPVAPGDLLKRPKLARTLGILRDEGAAPFFSGDIARAIAEAAQEADGILTFEDMKSYRVIPREPFMISYRGLDIATMGPPSSAGILFAQILQVLEGFPLGEWGWNADTVHHIVEAFKHAFADRARYGGDADHVDIPIEELTSPERAERIRAMIDADGVLDTDAYGTAGLIDGEGGTSHLSIIDGAGNMLACTSTINTRFGSFVVVDEYGIILNNEMADFNLQPGVPNVFGLIGTEQNAVDAGKRPLSSMSPTLVLRDGAPLLSIGASGGPMILSGTLMTMLRIIDFEMDPVEAVAA